MAEAKTLKEYQEFGRKLVDLGVSSNDLETRINGLDAEVPQDKIRSVITGFVDRLLEKEYSEEAAYEIINGFARFTYNGDFREVRRRALENILKRGSESLFEWLRNKRKDTAALRDISIMALEKNPEITYTWHPKEGREEALRKIVETHYDNEKARETVSYCLRDLGDSKKLSAFGAKHASTNPSFAWELLVRSEEGEDLRTAVAAWSAKNPELAYEASEKIINEWRIKETEQDKATNAELRDRLIKKNPEYVLGKLKQQDSRYNERNKELIIAIGRQYLERGELEKAKQAFEDAKYSGPEMREIGMRMLLEHKKYESLESCKYVMRSAAIAYFEQGGDTRIAVKYINDFIFDEMSDELRRKFGKALAKCTKKNGSDMTDTAYTFMMCIRKKTPSDNKSIDGLRKRIMTENDWALSRFIGHNDEEGVRAYLDKNKEKIDPEQLYSTAKYLKDDELRDQARHALIAKGIHTALRVFKEAKDDKGIEYVRARFTEGVDPALAQIILPLDHLI